MYVYEVVGNSNVKILNLIHTQDLLLCDLGLNFRPKYRWLIFTLPRKINVNLTFNIFWNYPIQACHPRGCRGCHGMAPHDTPRFWQSCNYISTRGGRICPSNYNWHSWIFRPSYGPAVFVIVKILSSLKMWSPAFHCILKI